MTDHTRKQVTGLSCGAACLLVAARELGVTHYPSDAFGTPPGTAINFDDNDERRVYHVTSAGQSGYSMPDGIARAARALGMGVGVSMSGYVVPKALEWKYPGVRQALTDMGVAIGSGAPALADNERMLVAVGIGVLGLHWVLYRPNKTYMDPAYASNTSWGLWTMGQLGILRYWDTGIYIVVSYASAA